MRMNLKEKTNKFGALLFSALLLLGLLAGCGAPLQEGEETQNLRYGMSNAWDSLMPYQSISASNYARIVYDKLYDRLVYVTEDGSCLPRAADSWESVDEGYGIVFHLNENAKFHDGTPVTAQHWEETFRLMTDPACLTIGRHVFSDLVGTNESGEQVLGETLGAEALDGKTFKLSLQRPVIPEEYLVASNREFYVLPTHLFADAAPEEIMDLALWKEPVGSGPMKFVSEISGAVLVLETNQNYHLGAPGFDTMTITVIDKANQLTSLLAGDLDYYAFGNAVSEENVTIAQEAGLTIVQGEVPTVFYELMLNNESVPQVELRQAIHLALDRELLAEHTSGSLGEPVGSSILPNTQYALASMDLSQDLIGAKALVEEHYDGRTLTLACTAARSSLAALIQQDLQAAGFQVEVHTVDSATLFVGMYDGDYDMAIASHTPTVLPLWFVGTRFRDDNNLFRVANGVEYTTRIDKVEQTMEQGQRQVFVQELEEYLQEQMPFVPLWISRSLYIESPTVTGIDYPAASFSNENVWQWSMS